MNKRDLGNNKTEVGLYPLRSVCPQSKLCAIFCNLEYLYSLLSELLICREHYIVYIIKGRRNLDTNEIYFPGVQDGVSGNRDSIMLK